MTRIVSFWLLVAIIVAVALLFYRVMSGFLLPLFLAALLVVIFQPIHHWVLARVRQPMVGAGVATAIVVLVVFVPAGWALTLAATEALSSVKQFDANRVTRQVQRLRVMLDLDLPQVEEILDLEPLFEELVRAERMAAASSAAPAAGGPPTGATTNGATTNGATADGETETDEPMPAPPPALPLVIEEPVDRAKVVRQLQQRVEEISGQMPRPEQIAGRAEFVKVVEQINQWRENLRHAQMVLGAGDEGEFADAWRKARQDYDRIKSKLPGGAVRVWLKGVINPSPERVEQWKERGLRDVQEWLLPAANATAGFALKFLFGTIIMIVSVFFFFADGQKMTVTVMRLIPLDVRHQEELLLDFGRISRAVVLATLISAVVQGVLAGLGFYFAGVESVAFLSLLTMVFAMIPFVGALSVWIPVCLWVGFAEGRFWPGVILAVYCTIVVSQSDNVVKPMILKGQSNLHPLLALLSILGGVQALGPAGILVGPMVVVFLQTLLNILHREMTSLERNGTGANVAMADGGALTAEASGSESAATGAADATGASANAATGKNSGTSSERSGKNGGRSGGGKKK